jgi:predicted MFS family arabinose efflux permease
VVCDRRGGRRTASYHRVEPRGSAPRPGDGSALFALGNLVVVLAPNYAIVAAVRVVQGAILPLFISVATAAVARLAGPRQAGRAIANVNVGVVIATVFAVPAGVFLADLSGWTASFVVLASLSGVAMLIVAAAFPRFDSTGLASFRDQASILGRPRFQAHLLLSAVLFVGMFAAYTYLAAFLQSIAGFNGQLVALTLVGFGLAGMVGNWVCGRVVNRGPIEATAATALVLALAMLVVSFAGGRLFLLLPVLAVWGAAHSAAFVLCHVRTMLAAPEAAAFAGSLNISVCNLGVASGAVVGGWVVERYGVDAIGMAGGLFAAAAVGIAFAMRAAMGRQVR